MIALLLLLLLAGPAPAETLLLSSPRLAVCEASPDAEFGVEQGELHPIRGFFSFAPPGELPLRPRISVPREVEPGGVVRVFAVSPDPLDGISAQLTDANGRSLSRATRFRLSQGEEGEAWVALIGIPCTAPPGPRTLEVKAFAGSRDCLLRADLPVSARTFAAETIALDKTLSDLRTVPDQRKAQEARDLARLLAVAHDDALFGTEPFAMPISTAWRRTAGYGDRREYRYEAGSSDLSVHGGIDMAAPEKTPVAACARGRVVFAGDRILTGKTVAIEHLPGVFSIYYHMADILAREGDVPAAGQQIGSVGKTGLATGPHLHWEVQILGTAVDPEALVRRTVLDREAVFLDIQGEKKPEGR